MGFKSILGTIGKTSFAAIAAAALPGSPFIGEAAKFVASKFGLDKIDATPEAIDAAIAATPDGILKLREADHEFQEYMTKIGFDSAEKIAELANADRADARAREIAVKDKTPQRLAYVDLFAFLAAFVVLLTVEVPTAIHDLLLIMVTTLGNNVITERSYYFGSSTGSEAKTKILASQASEKP